MPEIRPGRAYYATATKAVLHGAPAVEGGFVGIAIKKIAAPAGTGLGAAVITTVQVGELFHIETEGRVLVTNGAPDAKAGSPFAKGAFVNIDAADNKLTNAALSATVFAFGRVAEIAGERGVPTGRMRVDLIGPRAEGKAT